MRGLIGLFVLQVGLLLAQPADAPSFEVASVKLVAGPCSAVIPCSDDIETTPTGLSVHGVPLGLLIRWAWNLHLHQQPPIETVGPAWLEPGGDWTRYDVIAKTDRPATIAVGCLAI